MKIEYFGFARSRAAMTGLAVLGVVFLASGCNAASVAQSAKKPVAKSLVKTQVQNAQAKKAAPARNVAKFAASAPKSVPQNGTSAGNIGVNLEGLADWSRAHMFVDVMKTSRRWGSPQAPWDGNVAVDAQGWPLADAGVVLIADEPGIGGTYHLSFSGQGEVGGAGAGGAGVTIQNKKFNAATNLTTADVVVAANQNQLMLSFTKTNGGVRNVRLLRPGYAADSKETFGREFLARLKPFKTIRTMDVLSTNNSPSIAWADRTLPTFSSQARNDESGKGTGIALEYIAELANQTDTDLWINVPDQADDDYIRQMATLLKNSLEPGRKIYVEWSNEVWNWSFRQAIRNLEAAKKEIAGGDKSLNYDNVNNDGYWASRRVARKAMEVSNIFRAVFGDAQMMTRVRPVYAIQSSWDEALKSGLAFINEKYGAPSRYFYGIAGAPYFQISDELNKKKDLTLAEIFAALPVDMDTSLAAAKTLQAHARFYNLKLLAYEGGQHLQDHSDVGNGETKIQANRDPRMGAMIERELNGWNALGGDLFMYFTLSSPYTKWGSWGLLEDIRKPSAKYLAAVKVNQLPRMPLVAGTLLPATIRASDFDAQSHWAKAGSESVNVVKPVWFLYLVRAPSSGDYTLTASIASGTDGGKLEVSANSSAPVALDVPNSGGNDLWKDSAAATLHLDVGLNAIRIKGVDGNFQLKSLRVAR